MRVLDAIGEVVVIFLSICAGVVLSQPCSPAKAVEVLDGRLAAIQREVASAISLMLSSKYILRLCALVLRSISTL